MYSLVSPITASTIPISSFPFPTTEVILRGEEIGHPMLPASQRIVNDFQVARLHEFYIVTGANMAGKSTFYAQSART